MFHHTYVEVSASKDTGIAVIITKIIKILIFISKISHLTNKSMLTGGDNAVGF